MKSLYRCLMPLIMAASLVMIISSPVSSEYVSFGYPGVDHMLAAGNIGDVEGQVASQPAVEPVSASVAASDIANASRLAAGNLAPGLSVPAVPQAMPSISSPAGYGYGAPDVIGTGEVPEPFGVPCDVPCGPACPPVVTGGFTRTYQYRAAGGTCMPPVMEASRAFYSHPGISPYGAYPGCGFIENYGIGFTPCGYMPYGGFSYI